MLGRTSLVIMAREELRRRRWPRGRRCCRAQYAGPDVVATHGAEQVLADLTSNALFFNGPKAVEASARSIRPLPMVKLYAPDPYEPGSSIAHLDQDSCADFKTGLMTPRDFGSGTNKIDILTLGIMADIGYLLVPGAVTARTPRP